MKPLHRIELMPRVDAHSTPAERIAGPIPRTVAVRPLREAVELYLQVFGATMRFVMSVEEAQQVAYALEQSACDSLTLPDKQSTPSLGRNPDRARADARPDEQRMPVIWQAISIVAGIATSEWHERGPAAETTAMALRCENALRALAETAPERTGPMAARLEWHEFVGNGDVICVVCNLPCEAVVHWIPEGTEP